MGTRNYKKYNDKKMGRKSPIAVTVIEWSRTEGYFLDFVHMINLSSTYSKKTK